MTDSAEQQVELVVRRLQGRLPAVPARALERAVDVEFQSFSSARVRDFLPVLIERRLWLEFDERRTP
jgi:hypothetical protein